MKKSEELEKEKSNRSLPSESLLSTNKYKKSKSLSLNPVIILVAPQMGENIGATARAMKNFDISELRIVSPRDGWPNKHARSMAVGAVDIVDNAKIYRNIEESIGDIEYLYATSSESRNINKNHILSKDLAADYPIDTKVAIMFGRENCGLNNKEITLAHKVITINTSNFNSLNIAQAVIIIVYELFRNNFAKANINNHQILASRKELHYFFEHLFDELDKKNFFKIPEKTLIMKQNIMNIFSRIDKLSHTEVQALRGIINNLSSKSLM